MRWLVGAAAIFGLAGCQQGDPENLLLTFGSYASSPVILTEVTVNTIPMAHGQIVATEADVSTPRTSDSSLVGYPRAVSGGQVVVTASWIELFTAKAWTAQISGPLSAFVRDGATDTLRIGPVFGPNGLIILTSDPIPDSATDIPTVDVARQCARRVPSADFDYTADPGALPGMPELLQFDFPTVTKPECPAQD